MPDAGYKVPEGHGACFQEVENLVGKWIVNKGTQERNTVLCSVMESERTSYQVLKTGTGQTPGS